LRRRLQVAAFEQKTGKQVELTLYPQEEHAGKLVAALAAGQPPDFAFNNQLEDYLGQWAAEDRLADLSDATGAFSNLFDPGALAWVTWRNAKNGHEALYGLPVGRMINHVHVWKSLLERAGLSIGEIPKTWAAFWPFWCDQVQPAVRKALGRDDIWGIGLAMSVEAHDTTDQFFQFVAAYDADYVGRDGRLVIDEPEIRRKLIRAIDDYTAIYRKGCTPPDSVTWTGYDNNREFLARAVVMTPNVSLSIPNALKQERPEDYYKNTATIEWPLGAYGERFSDRRHRRFRRGLQGRTQRRPRQGVRPVPHGRGLANALSRLLRRALLAIDSCPPRPAVLARPERPASNGIGDADELAVVGSRVRLRRDLRQLEAPAG
jgi:ABC-type glycerol-3-phosphate transport system substrate-binding protein